MVAFPVSPAVRRCIVATLAGLMLPLGPPSWATTLHYEAPVHKAAWTMQQERFSCALRHEIPSLGVATFRRDSLSDVGFSLQVEESLKQGGEARLVAEPPAWQPDLLRKDLGEVSFTAGTTPFRLGRQQALRALAELERGMQVTFYPAGWDAMPERVSITLSTVNIRPALAGFRACMAALPVFDRADLRDSLLLFDTDSTVLSQAVRQRLDRLCDYIGLNPAIRGVYIEAHTDDVATRRYNRALSQKRARAVRDYLVGKGVPAGLVHLKSYGEERPAVSNRSEAGRRQNRRVRVRLDEAG